MEVDVDSLMARAFGREVVSSVKRLRAASLSASFILSKSNVRKLPFPTCSLARLLVVLEG